MNVDTEAGEASAAGRTTSSFAGAASEQGRPALEVVHEPYLSRTLMLRLAELAIFLAAVVGAVALGLGISDYFSEHAYVGAYLLAYGGFRLADVLVREDERHDQRDELGRRIGEQLPLLALFAAAPFERTYLLGGGPPEWLSIFGLILALVGFWLALGARIQLAFYAFDPRNPGRRVLVRSVFYRHVRHPMYLGLFLALAAWPLLYGAPIVLVTALVVGGLVAHHHIAAEEALMRDRFGEEYEDYCRETDALIPSLW